MKSSLIKSHTSGVKTVLVEDEEILSKNIKVGLERQGYTVYPFMSAESAEKFLLKHHEAIDIMLLDIMLPGKSGIEMCEYIRAKGIRTPILMLTAKDTPRDAVNAFDLGADDYLVKPFSFDELFARIRAIARRFSKTELNLSSTLNIGDLILDTSKKKVFYNKTEVQLTLKEFNLLQYLMEHPNEVLERELLLEKIWDINFNSFSNVLDVHIKNIRKKIKKISDSAVVETIRGVGYRLKK